MTFRLIGNRHNGTAPYRKEAVKFFIVTINYFTKWVEAEPTTTITEAKITSFVWKNIVYRFGIPNIIISDNGKQFDNPMFRKFCQELGIKNHYSSRHPQANGQTEVTNRNLLKIIKTWLEGQSVHGQKSYLTFYGIHDLRRVINTKQNRHSYMT